MGLRLPTAPRRAPGLMTHTSFSIGSVDVPGSRLRNDTAEPRARCIDVEGGNVYRYRDYRCCSFVLTTGVGLRAIEDQAMYPRADTRQ